MLPASKGRPPLEPRLAALERRVAEIERIESQRQAKPNEAVLGVPEVYEPLFNRWPKVNGS
jgi:hypothetical protein